MKLIQFFESLQHDSLARAIYKQLVHGDWSEAEGYQADHLLDEIEQKTGQDLENPSDFGKIIRFIKGRYLDPMVFPSQVYTKIEQLRGGPFEAYRGMSLSVGDQEALFGTGISQDSQKGSQMPVGRYWTWDMNVAKEMIGGRGRNLVILHSKINPTSVDWLNTLAANAIWGESEIRVKSGAPIELLDVLDASTGRSIAKPRGDVVYVSEARTRLVSSEDAAVMIADDDELFDAVASYTTYPDVFDDYPEQLQKFLGILKMVRPFKKRLYRGELSYEYNNFQPYADHIDRGFTSWTAAKDVAKKWFNEKGNMVKYTDGPVRAVSIADLATARMRLRQGESHYSGMQSEYLVLEPVKRKIPREYL